MANTTQSVERETKMKAKTETPKAQVELDPAKVRAFRSRLEEQQNFPMALVGGFAAALVGAALWAAITVTTKYQIGFMALAVGIMVGFAVRALGKGVSTSFGIAGGALALVGCVLGNVLSACGFVAIQEAVPFTRVASTTLANPALAFDLLRATFNPMDLLFYGLAVYEGYRFAFRRITQDEMARLARA